MNNSNTKMSDSLRSRIVSLHGTVWRGQIIWYKLNLVPSEDCSRLRALYRWVYTRWATFTVSFCDYSSTSFNLSWSQLYCCKFQFFVHKLGRSVKGEKQNIFKRYFNVFNLNLENKLLKSFKHLYITTIPILQLSNELVK